MKLSVVLVTFNRASVLKKLLRCFEKQTDRDFELVVVSDGSTDGTHELLECYRQTASFPMRWFDTGLVDCYGLAVARNRGIREASGEAVVILDDDSFPTKQFIAEHKKSVTPQVLTGGGMSHTDPYGNRKEQMQEYLDVYGDCTPREFMPFTKHKHKYVVENNTCMYKTDWFASGLFDESVNEYGVIAYSFLDHLKELGFRYQFNPRAKIIHRDEYQRSYGDRTKMPHTVPVWLKKVLFPIKQFLKRHTPRFYTFLKRVVGRSI